MHACLRLAVACLLLALAAASVHAQEGIERFYGRPVVAVRFEIEGREAQASLQSLVEVRPGEPLRPETIRDSMVHLVSAGRFEDVKVLGTETPDGVTVLFSLVPRHPIDRVDFSGTDTGLSKADLERLVRQRYGGLPVRDQPQAVAGVLESLLEDEGFPSARVTPRVEPTHNPDRATLVLDVQAGPRLIIANTEVIGASLWPPSTIIERTHTQRGQPFRRRALEAELAAIADEMHRRGHYTAIAVLQGAPALGAPAAPEGVNITLNVEAGPRVTLQWDGPKPRGDDEAFVPIQRQASADPDLLEDSDQRVARYWQQQGYRDVKVTHASERQGDQLIITMRTQLGLRYRVRNVVLSGVAHMADAVVREKLVLTSGDWYDQSRLARGLAQLRQSYRLLGFYQVQARELDAEEVESSRTAADVQLVVRVDVVEGPQAAIGRLEFSGVRPDLERLFRERLLRSRPGTPYVVEYVLRDRIDVDQYYHDHGFENEVSEFTPRAGAAAGTMDLAIKVTEGPQATIADIRVVGNEQVDDKIVREALTLKEGAPFGEAERLESQNRLYQLGVFRRVSIDEEQRLPGETTTHVIVTVEELPPRILNFGGGVEAERRPRTQADGTVDDRIVVAPRVSFEIGRRNLGGKNRSIDFFTRAALRPSDVPGKHFGFSEYRVSGTYFEPRAFESDTNLTAGLASEQGSRADFNFARNSVNADVVRRVSPRINLSGRYALEFTRLFDSKIKDEDKPLIDRFFSQVRLSLLSSGLLWDRRNDPVAPVRGTFTTADVEFATRALGSEVGYAKIFLQSSAFRLLSTHRQVVLGVRGELGVARGFEREVVAEDGSIQTVADLPPSQRFFAGGSTTVRGFQLDRLGVQGIVNKDGLSLGGNAVVVLNAEIRTTVGKLKGRDFGLVGFTDGGNVFARARDLDLSKIRGTYGFGVRYDSPLGPVRLDFGFKMDRRTIGGRRERAWEYHLNIGEAF